MNLTFPEYSSLEKTITPYAYNKVRETAQGRINQALQIYEAYSTNHDDDLYEAFEAALEMAKPALGILQLVIPRAMVELSGKLWEAGEALSYMENSHRPTMLMDIAGALKEEVSNGN